MSTTVVAPRVQWDEMSRGLVITSQELLSKLSVRNVLSQSWEAGGVYPTLLGYALGAVATFAVVGASHWALRFPPAVFCGIVFVQTLTAMESSAFAFLLAFAAAVGVGCTFVQVRSWQDAFASVAHRRKMHKKRRKQIKADKEN